LIGFARRKLFGLSRAYAATFQKGSPETEMVLADLKRFCHADTPCWAEDPREHAMREGRREVWLRIQQHLKLTDADIDRLTDVLRSQDSFEE